MLASNLNATFTKGTLNAIVGRNGSGKSTLLRVTAGLAKPLAGEVLIAGDGSLERRVSLVSTERVRALNLRVRDLVSLGRAPYTGWAGRLTEQDHDSIDTALKLVGMSSFTDKYIDTLSDGEAQRVMIARALAQDTPVMLLDEPTAFLDYHSRREIVELLVNLAQEQGKTIIFSSHELDLVEEFADKVIKL